VKILILRCWSFLVSLAFVLVIGSAMYFLLSNALPGIDMEAIFGTTPPIDAIFKGAMVWDALWPAIAGTAYLLVLAMLLVLPLGTAGAVYLSEYAPARFRRIALSVLEIFTAIPSIVIGLFGFLLVVCLHRVLLPRASTSLLLAAFCLTLLVLPTFILTFHAAMRGLPHSLRVTASAIGLCHHAAVWHVFLPASGRGLASAFFLSAGRCAEDTAVILLTGAIANASTAPSLTGKFEALPFFIYYTTANYQSPEEFSRIFVAVFFLMVLACILLFGGALLQKVTFKHWNDPL